MTAKNIHSDTPAALLAAITAADYLPVMSLGDDEQMKGAMRMLEHLATGVLDPYSDARDALGELITRVVANVSLYGVEVVLPEQASVLEPGIE